MRLALHAFGSERDAGRPLASDASAPADLAAVPETGAGGAAAPYRLALFMLAAMVVLALALLLDHLYFERRSEADRGSDFAARLAQAQGALERGEYFSAERSLVELSTLRPGDPALQSLRAGIEARRRAQETYRERLRAAGATAARALGLDPPAAALSTVLPEAPSPVVSGPAAAAAPAHADAPVCNATLAALALCAEAPAVAVAGDAPAADER